MAEHADIISVRERCEDELRATLIRVTGIDAANVQDFDEDGNEPKVPAGGAPPTRFVTIAYHDEDEAIGGDEGTEDVAALGTETMILPATIDMHVLAKPSGQTWRQCLTRQIALLKKAVMSNPQLREGGPDDGDGEELALLVKIRGSSVQLPKDRSDSTSGGRGILGKAPPGRPMASIDIEIWYRHAEGEPDENI